MSGGSGEGEVAFVKPTKAPENRKKTAQSLSAAEKEAANGEIRALKEKHAKMMGDYQKEFMKAAESGDFETLNALPQKFAERMRAFQESVDAIADKYGIVINETGAGGRIASTKQDGNYDGYGQNRYNSVTSLDKSGNSAIINLNPLNSNPLLAYTRQWDKVCDTSYFRAKNAEIISYFGVFTLLETAFMQ